MRGCLLENQAADYRELSQRREGFLQFWAACTDIGDVDPHLWAINYINRRYEHSIEERLWMAWLFHTYQLPQAWVFKSEFPDEELASVERFENWTNENYSRLTYQTDTKWSKGHLSVMYASYHKWLGNSSQSDKFNGLCQGSPEENFNVLWKEFNSLHKIGRYTAYFLLQTFKHTCNLSIECPSLFLSDFEGSKSHRNGLCLAAGKDDWVGQRLTPQEYMWLEGFGADLLNEAHTRWPRFAKQMDTFALETIACAAKKLWRVRDGRYVGFYLDRQSEDIMKTASRGWVGIDWRPMWEAREETIPSQFVPRYAKVDKTKMSFFLDTGGFRHYAAEG
jgi:hypothetical protein